MICGELRFLVLRTEELLVMDLTLVGDVPVRRSEREERRRVHDLLDGLRLSRRLQHVLQASHVDRDELGRIGEPGLDDGGGVEDGVAAGGGVEDGAGVGDVAVREVEGAGAVGGGAGEGGEVAGGAHEGADGVAVGQESGAQLPAEETGGAGQQDLHPLRLALPKSMLAPKRPTATSETAVSSSSPSASTPPFH